MQETLGRKSLDRAFLSIYHQSYIWLRVLTRGRYWQSRAGHITDEVTQGMSRCDRPHASWSRFHSIHSSSDAVCCSYLPRCGGGGISCTVPRLPARPLHPDCFDKASRRGLSCRPLPAQRRQDCDNRVLKPVHIHRCLRGELHTLSWSWPV